MMMMMMMMMMIMMMMILLIFWVGSLSTPGMSTGCTPGHEISYLGFYRGVEKKIDLSIFGAQTFPPWNVSPNHKIDGKSIPDLGPGKGGRFLPRLPEDFEPPPKKKGQIGRSIFTPTQTRGGSGFLVF